MDFSRPVLCGRPGDPARYGSRYCTRSGRDGGTRHYCELQTNHCELFTTTAIMPLLKRKLFLPFLLILLLLFAAWVFTHQFTQVALETYIPETALGYVEVNDMSTLLEKFTATEAWKNLAPAYGLSRSFGSAGWLGKLSRWSGIGTGESLLFARGQFALVITGIEVRGDEVKPRMALVVETHGSKAQIKALIAERLLQLATRAYKNPVQETSEYAGVPVTIFRAPQGDRKILATSIDSELIVANDPDALRVCIEARQGRVPTIAKNNFLSQAKNAVKGNDEVFAFVNKSGAARLSQFLAHIVAGKVIEGTPLAGLLENLAAEISKNAVEAMAYSTSFEGGDVADRYAILCQPQMAESLRSTIRVAGDASLENSAALKLIPASAQEITLLHIDDPNQALDGVEKIISANIGVAESFLFHRFFMTARKTFLGLEPGETASNLIGNEVLRVSLATSAKEENSPRVWLIAARNAASLTNLAGRLLRQQGNGIKRESYRNLELQSSGDEKRAYVFLNNFLVLGDKENVKRLLDEHEKKSSLRDAPQFTAAIRSASENKSAMYSFSSVTQETQKMMSSLAYKLKGKPDAQVTTQLNKLPLATSNMQVNERGIQLATRSPFGNFPAILAFVDSIF